MKGLALDADWEPREDYLLSDFERQTGKAITESSVWRNPKLVVQEVETPKPGPDQVLLRVKNCGVCGSDIHFYETDEEGYILYPGLTKFPTILGHEFSSVVYALMPKRKLTTIPLLSPSRSSTAMSTSGLSWGHRLR